MIEIDAIGQAAYVPVKNCASMLRAYIGSDRDEAEPRRISFDASHLQVQCPKSFFPAPKAVSKAVSAPVAARARRSP